MKYAVTANRQFVRGGWNSINQVPYFELEAFNQNEAESKAKDIIGSNLYLPSLSVVALHNNGYHRSIGILVTNASNQTGRIMSVDLEAGYVKIHDAQWNVSYIQIAGIAPVDSRDWKRIHSLINDWIQA